MKRGFQLFVSAFLSFLIVIMMVGMVFVHYTCPKCEAMHNAMTLCSSEENPADDDGCQDLSMPCYTLQVVKVDIPTAEVQKLTVPAPVLIALLQTHICFLANPSGAAAPQTPGSERSVFAPPPRAYLSRLCTLLI